MQIGLRRCVKNEQTSTQLQWKANRKSHTGFRLVLISMTLNDFERPQRVIISLFYTDYRVLEPAV